MVKAATQVGAEYGKKRFYFFCASRFPFLRDESEEVRGICGDHRLNC
jgi:hypothetical protein